METALFEGGGEGQGGWGVPTVLLRGCQIWLGERIRKCLFDTWKPVMDYPCLYIYYRAGFCEHLYEKNIYLANRNIFYFPKKMYRWCAWLFDS